MRFATRVAVRPRVTRAWVVAFVAVVSVGAARGVDVDEFEGDFVALLRGGDSDATEETPLSDDRNRGRRLLGRCSNTCETFSYGGCDCNDGEYKKDVGDCRYGTSNEYSCAACHTSCRKCDGSGSSDCTACRDGEYKTSGQCLSCDDDCETCWGGSSVQCSSCFQSGSKPHFYFSACFECTSDSHCTTNPKNVCSGNERRGFQRV